MNHPQITPINLCNLWIVWNVRSVRALQCRGPMLSLPQHRKRTLRLVLLLSVVSLLPISQVSAQSKPVAPAKSPLCTRDNALDMIKQQAAISKTYNDPVRRITLLIRVGDLLWPHQQDKARAVYTEAFEVAVEKEKETDEKEWKAIIVRMQKPDQRYIVIRAVAKRDIVWARELMQQVIKPDGKTLAARGSFESALHANRLLESAHQLIATDLNVALELAMQTLGYPAGFGLTRFLYRLAEVNQKTADDFYSLALDAYSDKPLREFLYLQAYPFAWSDTRNTPVASFHKAPANFVINQSLQRRFMQVMLRRAQLALEAPLDEGDTYRSWNVAMRPGTVHLLEGLIRLEPQVSASLPDLLAPLTQAREKLLVSLSPENQTQLLEPGREISATPDKTLEEQVELAEKLPDVHERDSRIASAVLSAGFGDESVTRVLPAIEKISESTLRAHLTEWIYFRRASSAAQSKQFDEAERLASKVEGHELRAFLHTEIAKGLLNKSETQTRGRELLDEAITEAKKAGISIFAARTLLTASSLYLKIDLNRSIEVLADAINCINRIEAPDFFGDDQSLQKTPERKGRGGRYAGEYLLWFYMPGLDPERAFREMAKSDFDTALSQNSGLTDKFQRGMATLGLAEVCLQQPQPQPKKKG